MSAIEPGPNQLQLVVAVAGDLRRALWRVQQVQEVAGWIEHDHTNPTERSAVAVVTREGPQVAELWRFLRSELGGAKDAIDEVLEELDDLGDTLGNEAVL
jgi:hypothetical protein